MYPGFGGREGQVQQYALQKEQSQEDEWKRRITVKSSLVVVEP
jgi:hypothetical protein